MTTQIHLHIFLLFTVFTFALCEEPMTCYNLTMQKIEDFEDVTLFQGAPTVTCEDNFGCSKTLISKGGAVVGVARGCGIYGCLGKSCYNLHGHRMCLHCCRKSKCNGAGRTTFSLTVTVLSQVAGWLLTKHC